MLWGKWGTGVVMSVALTDTQWSTAWYFFSLRWWHAVSPDTHSSPQPE